MPCALQLLNAESLQERRWLLQVLQRWLRGWLAAGGRVAAAEGPLDGLPALIGNTQLVRIRSLSEQTGCEVRCNAVLKGVLPRASPACSGVHCARLALTSLRESNAAKLLPSVQILAKAEFMNPGGSVKDRVALEIVQEAFQEGRLQRGGLVTEGTVGSTGALLYRGFSGGGAKWWVCCAARRACGWSGSQRLQLPCAELSRGAGRQSAGLPLSPL